MRRRNQEKDLDRIASLYPGDQEPELREYLAGADLNSDSVFRHEAQLRPALRELARDPQVTLAVRKLLALIAEPEDLRWLGRCRPGPDLVTLAELAARALNVGALLGNKPPLLNESGDKALIEMQFRSGDMRRFLLG